MPAYFYLLNFKFKKMKSIKLLIAFVMLFNTNITFAQANTSINNVINNYMQLKDALIKSDGTLASAAASTLLKAIKDVDMNTLNATTHTQWMQVVNDLKEDAEHINETKELSHQRDHFMSLSKNLYSVLKISKNDTPVYYQFCPMANKGKGANWLSFDNKVKNPYYGNQMLTCGKVVDTIQ